MLNLDFFENRKKELISQFEKITQEIQGFNKAIQEKQEHLSQMRGAYAETEVSIKKLNDLKVSESASDAQAV